MTSYEARGHYQNVAVASNYDEQFRRVRGLADARTQVLGYFETRAFDSLLSQAGPPGRVLDVACGTGRYLRRLLDAQHRVVGADVSGEMLAIARQNNAGRSNLIALERCDAARLPFKSGEFDGVTCMRLYHRIPPDLRRQMLSEVRRVSRSWALLFFGLTDPWLRLRQQARSALGGRHSNPYPLEVDEVREEVKRAGFELVDSRRILPGVATGYLTLLKIAAPRT